jgi:hypothetical protein
VNPHLDFLVSVLYDDCLHPEHRADLRKSGITDATIWLQKIRTIPPSMLEELAGFSVPASVTSAFVLPFFDTTGRLTSHIRLKIFPSLTTPQGRSKYLQPRKSGVRIYFPLAALDAVLHSTETLHIVEGEKKSLAVVQLGLAAIGICGIEGWHLAGSKDLHPDLDDVGLQGRVVNIIPDADLQTNPAVNNAVNRLARALERRGASVNLTVLPLELSA